MLINTELLKTFLVAATHESFRAAAAARFVTVSAISQQMKTLETQLAVALFDRVGRRVVLTDEGRALAARVRPAFGTIDDAVDAAVRGRASIAGLVRIGTARAFGGHWLRPRLARLLDAYPDMSVRLELDVPSVLERRLSEGELDLAILVRGPELATVTAERIATERFEAVASPVYLARWGTPRTADDFRAHRWAIFDRDLAMHAPWWRAKFGRKAPLPERVVVEAPSLEMMLELVLGGAVMAVLPGYFVGGHVRARALRIVRPSAQSHAENPIYLAWRRGGVPSARVTAAREALQAVRAPPARPDQPRPKGARARWSEGAEASPDRSRRVHIAEGLASPTMTNASSARRRILYANSSGTSPYVLSVFVTLREKGLEFDLETVALERGAQHEGAFVAQSITSRVPVLDDGGFALSESSAIVEYLEDVYAPPTHARVLPENAQDRARARQIMAWVRSDLMPIRVERSAEYVFYPHAEVKPFEPLSDAAERAVAKLYAAADRFVPEGGGPLFGAWCVADTDLAMMLQRLVKTSNTVPAKLRAYAEAQWQRPAVQEFVAQKRPPYEASV